MLLDLEKATRGNAKPEALNHARDACGGACEYTPQVSHEPEAARVEDRQHQRWGLPGLFSSCHNKRPQASCLINNGKLLSWCWRLEVQASLMARFPVGAHFQVHTCFSLWLPVVGRTWLLSLRLTCSCTEPLTHPRPNHLQKAWPVRTSV